METLLRNLFSKNPNYLLSMSAHVHRHAETEALPGNRATSRKSLPHCHLLAICTCTEETRKSNLCPRLQDHCKLHRRTSHQKIRRLAKMKSCCSSHKNTRSHLGGPSCANQTPCILYASTISGSSSDSSCGSGI